MGGGVSPEQIPDTLQVNVDQVSIVGGLSRANFTDYDDRREIGGWLKVLSLSSRVKFCSLVVLL